ncbi:hypothetical protein MHH67_05110 [Bacillus sp. FSL K6-0047]
MNIDFFIETMVPIIIAITSLIFQILDRYKPKTETKSSFPVEPNFHPNDFNSEIDNTSTENRKTLARWLRKIILITTASTLIIIIFLKVKKTSHLLVDDKTGLPTLEKILDILSTSIQEVQHYLLYLIIGLLISMLIIDFIQKKVGKIIYNILLGASAFMAHHIMNTHTFFKINPADTVSVHNLIQTNLPIILAVLFVFQIYLCYFIINSIFVPRKKTKLIDEKAKHFFGMAVPITLPFLIYIALQI